MSLDNDLYTLFNDNWDENVIRKPNFHTTESLIKKGVGDFNIITNKLRGPRNPSALDHHFYSVREMFSLIYYEMSESDLSKVESEVMRILGDPVNNTIYEIYSGTPTERIGKLFWEQLDGWRTVYKDYR